MDADESLLLVDEASAPAPPSRVRLRKGPAPPGCCAICLSEVHRPGRLSGCNHRFCLVCIYKWAQQSNACPCCRAPFERLWDESDPTFVVEVEPQHGEGHRVALREALVLPVDPAEEVLDARVRGEREAVRDGEGRVRVAA